MIVNYCCCKKCENLVKTRKKQYASEEINLGSMLCSSATATGVESDRNVGLAGYTGDLG